MHEGGSNWVNTGPMKLRLPFLNNTNPIYIPKTLFNDTARGSNLLQPKRDWLQLFTIYQKFPENPFGK